MKRILFLIAMLLALIVSASEAKANGKSNPFGYSNVHNGSYNGFFGKTPVPAFMAAPWYLYWPYNAHFQTPAPMYNAPYYGPPSSGYGGMVNPYFAPPQYNR